MISVTAESDFPKKNSALFRLCATIHEASQMCQDDLIQALLGLCDGSAIVSNSSNAWCLADRMSWTVS